MHKYWLFARRQTVSSIFVITPQQYFLRTMDFLAQPVDDLLPITIPEAIESLNNTILEVVRKNRTLIEYYIYPQETPSEIEAYKPRLHALHLRVESLAAISLPKLTLVVDDAAALIAAFLLPIIDQLLNAVHGIQEIFVNHYDRDLAQRKPYGTLYETLLYRERQLKVFQKDQMQSPQRKLADALNPIPPTSSQPVFCRFAIAFANARDYGKVSQVLSDDLKPEDVDRLRNDGGAFLSWDCPGCAFKIKYHISSSMASNIHATDDVRTHSSIPEIQYRPSWLVKCHLYQAKSTDRRASVYADEPETPRPKSRRESVGARQQTVTKRQAEARSPKPVSLFSFGTPQVRRTKSEVKTTKVVSTKQIVEKATKPLYGCPFCWVIGKDYGHMGYCHARDLTEHISARHSVNRAPSSLVLEKYMIGLNGKCAANVRRWDLNIRSIT